MPGASAASAPSIRLSHFLFAHLLHGFILPFLPRPPLLARTRARLYASASFPVVLEKNLSGARARSILGNKMDMIACAIARARCWLPPEMSPFPLSHRPGSCRA